jgi:hypothetical protein
MPKTEPRPPGGQFRCDVQTGRREHGLRWQSASGDTALGGARRRGLRTAASVRKRRRRSRFAGALQVAGPPGVPRFGVPASAGGVCDQVKRKIVNALAAMPKTEPRPPGEQFRWNVHRRASSYTGYGRKPR